MQTFLSPRASLLLNIALAATAATLVLHRPAPASPATAPAPADTRAAASASESAASNPSVVVSPYTDETAPLPERRRWLVDRLRDMGVPEPVLARLVLSDIEAYWTPRAAEIARKSYGDPDTMAAVQLEIDTTRDAELRDALGEAAFLEWDMANMIREANQGGIRLAPAEMSAAYALWKNMRLRELELRGARQSARMDDLGIGLEYEKNLTAFERDMKALLGEERFAQARSADEGNALAELRTDLAQASPNKAQLGELLETRRQWDALRMEIENTFAHDPSSADREERLRALDEARELEYRRVLGDEAFESLQKEQHPGYALMRKYADMWGLDDRKIDATYGSIRYHEKALEDYRSQIRALETNGQTVDWNEVAGNLRQFTEQTRRMLKKSLGDETFARLEENGVLRLDGDALPHGATIDPAYRRGS
jgi:hypothetical protein